MIIIILYILFFFTLLLPHEGVKTAVSIVLIVTAGLLRLRTRLTRLRTRLIRICIRLIRICTRLIRCCTRLSRLRIRLIICANIWRFARFLVPLQRETVFRRSISEDTR